MLPVATRAIHPTEDSARYLLSLPAKRCLIANMFVIHEDKVLLVHHRKLNLWMAPGGHVDEGESPHLTAERECYEETGLRCQAVEPYFPRDTQRELFIPNPVHSHIHWMSEENYRRRQQDPEHYQPLPHLKRACEQHVSFDYLGRPRGSLKLTLNRQETLGLGWFTRAEARQLSTPVAFQVALDHVWVVAARLLGGV